MAKKKVTLYNKAGKEFPVNEDQVEKFIKIGFTRREVVTIPAELEERLQKITSSHERTESALETKVVSLNGVIAEKEKEIQAKESEIQALKVENENLKFDLNLCEKSCKKILAEKEAEIVEPELTQEPRPRRKR